jgi:hypothetical protein
MLRGPVRSPALSGAVALALLSSLVAAGSAAAIPSADAIARINAVRVANGIPPVVEDPALSAACQSAARYLALNRGWDRNRPHSANPDKPGYTPEGANAAAHSVLAGPPGWTNPHPWASAPFHRRQVLDPGLTATGYGEQAGYACLDTLSAPHRATAGQIFTVPGPGAIGVARTEVASELDSRGEASVPGDSVGLPAGTRTGPNMIVYADWPQSVEYGAARLTGPDGPVAVASTSGFVIPRKPLASRTRYRVEIDLLYPETVCTLRGTAYPPADEQSLCPPSSPTWCVSPAAPPAPPDWIPVGAQPLPERLCDPGETPPLDVMMTLPGRSVTHRWEFTTDGPRCRQALTAPRSIKSRTPLIVRARACASATVKAAVYRMAPRAGRSKQALFAKRISLPGPGRSQLRLPAGRLRPGSYRLDAAISGAGATKRLSQRFRISAR